MFDIWKAGDPNEMTINGDSGHFDYQARAGDGVPLRANGPAMEIEHAEALGDSFEGIVRRAFVGVGSGPDVDHDYQERLKFVSRPKNVFHIERKL